MNDNEVLEALGESFVVVDPEGAVEYTSARFAEWPGALPRLRAIVVSIADDDPLEFVEQLWERWARVTVRRLASGGFLVLVRDIDAEVRAREEVKRLRLRVLTVQEDERRAISQNLHDELGQGMTALALQVGGLMEGVDDPQLAQSLVATRSQVELITKRMRQLFYRIRPPGLHDDSLSVALGDYCRSIAHSSGLGVIFDAVPELPTLDGAEATALYRLLQEATTNVIKHAAAESVWVSLTTEDDAVSLAVEDDGEGFDPRVRASGIGLAGLRERFEMLGGELVVDSRIGSGTRISGSVPVPAGDRA
jgi:signal transduction histidine kinase